MLIILGAQRDKAVALVALETDGQLQTESAIEREREGSGLGF